MESGIVADSIAKLPLIVIGLLGLGAVVSSIRAIRENNKNSKIIICEENQWLELGIKYLRDPDNKQHRYIRTEEMVTKATLEASWFWIGYEYFEPDGDIRGEMMGSSILHYTPVAKAMADKLEKAYHKKRGQYVKAKQDMHTKALKSFLA